MSRIPCKSPQSTGNTVFNHFTITDKLTSRVQALFWPKKRKKKYKIAKTFSTTSRYQYIIILALLYAYPPFLTEFGLPLFRHTPEYDQFMSDYMWKNHIMF